VSTEKERHEKLVRHMNGLESALKDVENIFSHLKALVKTLKETLKSSQ
jgi:hypothetical protein